jgi:hypothetical protein
MRVGCVGDHGHAAKQRLFYIRRPIVELGAVVQIRPDNPTRISRLSKQWMLAAAACEIIAMDCCRSVNSIALKSPLS